MAFLKVFFQDFRNAKDFVSLHLPALPQESVFEWISICARSNGSLEENHPSLTDSVVPEQIPIPSMFEEGRGE